MAKKLKDFHWTEKSPRAKYPWHEWTDGNTWEIVQGEDFLTTPAIMTVSLHNKATSIGLKVRTTSYVKRGGQSCIAFQFWTPTKPLRKHA